MGRSVGRFLIHAAITVALLAAVALIAALNGPFEIAGFNLVLRSQKGMNHDFPIPMDGSLVSFDRSPPRSDISGAPAGDAPRPRNVILVVGDGMGIGQVSAASAILHGPSGSLAMESAPVTGLVRTHAGNDLVPDSAAAGTAMATGYKAPRSAISVLADGREPATLFEAAQEAGLAVGIVTTSGLVDATPASFLAHAVDRYDSGDILEEMLASGAEILIGGDWSDHHEATRNAEYMDMLARIDTLADVAGYRLARTGDELDRPEGPVLALFPPRSSGGDAHGPDLETTARFAIEALSRNDRGFILLVESEVTDGAAHSNHIAEVVRGIAELDAAVTAILGLAASTGDTLVLVTADHDTGGVGIVRGRYTSGRAKIRWATYLHTAQWVPVFAFGPGAGRFSGVVDNTHIGVTIAELLELEGYPSFDHHPGG